MRRILLASVGLVVSIGTAQAACIPTPSCSTLGYESSTACEGGLKCPFGEYWNCTLVNKITEVETKVTELVENKGDSENSDCAIGNIYYSDKTCSISLDSSKTPIGVVVYSDGAGHGQIMAINSIGSYTWGSEDADISTLTNMNLEAASSDLNSCLNTEKIMAAGDKSAYPAAWAAHEYSTEGTKAGDWCLPAAGIITSYYNNKEAINIGTLNAGGTSTEIGWSSTEKSVSGWNKSAWLASSSYDYGLYSGGSYHYSGTPASPTYSTYDGSDRKEYSQAVRPVLEF